MIDAKPYEATGRDRFGPTDGHLRRHPVESEEDPEMMRRRRPLRRAAVVGGVAAAAHHAGKKSGEAQGYDQAQSQQVADQQQYAQPQYAAPPPAAPAAGGSDMMAELTNLKSLLDSGVLTQEEFDAQKQKVLNAS
jgi:hypothetical protein